MILPSFTITIPIRSRSRFVPIITKPFTLTKYPTKLISLYFVTHDNSDDTYDKLFEFGKIYGSLYKKVVLDKMDMNAPVDVRGSESRKYVRPCMIRAFNTCLDYGMYAGSDFTIMLPSDTLVSNSFLNELSDMVTLADKNGIYTIPGLDITKTYIDYIYSNILSDTDYSKSAIPSYKCNNNSHSRLLYTDICSFKIHNSDCISGLIIYPTEILKRNIRFQTIQRSEYFEFDYIHRLKATGVHCYTFGMMSPSLHLLHLRPESNT